MLIGNDTRHSGIPLLGNVDGEGIGLVKDFMTEIEEPHFDEK